MIFFRLSLLSCLLFLLNGCGQNGRLYLPAEAKPVETILVPTTVETCGVPK